MEEALHLFIHTYYVPGPVMGKKHSRESAKQPSLSLCMWAEAAGFTEVWTCRGRPWSRGGIR